MPVWGGVSVPVVSAEPQWSPSPAPSWRNLTCSEEREPQPTTTPSASPIGREKPPPSPASLVCKRRSVCMRERDERDRKRGRERGSSQCNGIEESEEEEEESEWEAAGSAFAFACVPCLSSAEAWGFFAAAPPRCTGTEEETRGRSHPTFAPSAPTRIHTDRFSVSQREEKPRDELPGLSPSPRRGTQHLTKRGPDASI